MLCASGIVNEHACKWIKGLFRFADWGHCVSEIELNYRIVRFNDQRTRGPFFGALLLAHIHQVTAPVPGYQRGQVGSAVAGAIIHSASGWHRDRHRALVQWM
jgi:hypothetical protein